MNEGTHFTTTGHGVKLIIDNELHLVGADGPTAAALRDRLTFINPQFEENERRGFSNWQTPHELCFLEKRMARPIGLKIGGAHYPPWTSPFKAGSGTSRAKP
jgi:hypothetical protein